MTDPIPISALEHYMYCPRQCALILVDQVWVESAHTARGSLGHRRVDTGEHRTERGRLVLRGVSLWSERLGLTGRADAVELLADGSFVPVEYKIGRRHGVAAHVQLCAQALCLEEMTGTVVGKGAIWFSGPRRRLAVAIDGALRVQTLAAIEKVRKLLDSDHLPAAPDDERCPSCQLVGHCLPGVVSQPEVVERYLREVVFG